MLNTITRTHKLSEDKTLDLVFQIDVADEEDLRYKSLILNTHAEMITLDAKFLSGELTITLYNDLVSSLKSRCAKLIASFPPQQGS